MIFKGRQTQLNSCSDAADGTVKHLTNVVAIRTVCKEVESVTGIQLRLSTLKDHVAATDVVRKKGRPSVFTVAALRSKQRRY